MTILTAAFAPNINVTKVANSSNKTKKNMATAAIAGLATAGAVGVSKQTYGKSFAWNTKINKALKNFVKDAKLSDKFTEISSKTKVGVLVKKAATSGLEFTKKAAGKLAKTTGRQKLLGALALGTLVTTMAVREYYSKKEGAEVQKEKDVKITDTALKTANKINKTELQKKDAIIADLSTELELKDVEINSQKKSIDTIEKAAEKIGVADQLVEELKKPEYAQ